MGNFHLKPSIHKDQNSAVADAENILGINFPLEILSIDLNVCDCALLSQQLGKLKNLLPIVVKQYFQLALLVTHEKHNHIQFT